FMLRFSAAMLGSLIQFWRRLTDSSCCLVICSRIEEKSSAGRPPAHFGIGNPFNESPAALAIAPCKNSRRSVMGPPLLGTRGRKAYTFWKERANGRKKLPLGFARGKASKEWRRREDRHPFLL